MSLEACLADPVRHWTATGEITTRLLMEATLARYHLTESERGMEALRPEYRCLYREHALAYLTIAAAMDEITAAGREVETRLWFPTLKAYYAASRDRGHSADGAGFKALLWGCAGRVLLTLRDACQQSDPLAKFGGAWATLIFDETSAEPRGGVQGLCATKDEALGLLRAALGPLEFRADEAVTIG